MEVVIIILCLIYVLIAYVIDRGIIGEWVEDTSDELDELPDWLIRFTIFILALFWIITVPVVIIRGILRGHAL